MFIAYLIVCSGVWANLQTLGEMTIAFPVSGNYIDYAARWVDPALAFGAGFAEWLGESSIPELDRLTLTNQFQVGPPFSLPKPSSLWSLSTIGLRARYLTVHYVRTPDQCARILD